MVELRQAHFYPRCRFEHALESGSKSPPSKMASKMAESCTEESTEESSLATRDYEANEITSNASILSGRTLSEWQWLQHRSSHFL